LIGRAFITPRAASAQATLPAEALLEVDGRAASIFVLTADGARAERRRVSVLWLDGAVAAIAGVDSSAKVVTAGATRLSDGTRVRVVGEDTP
jgi:hypothetical protein